MCVGNSDGSSIDLDPEGTLAADVRTIVGPECCIVMTLDLHANVTPLMANSLDAAISYDHYPHDDIFRTGQKAGWILLQAARNEIKPVMAISKINMMQTAFRSSTVLNLNGTRFGTAAAMLLRAKQRECGNMWCDQPLLNPADGCYAKGSWHYGELTSHDRALDGVLSVSLNYVHPHNDIPDLGNSAVVVVDAKKEDIVAGAQALADSLTLEMWARREDFAAYACSTQKAVIRGRKLEGPVLLLDLADCAGGGAAGDSIALVQSLLQCGACVSKDETAYTMCVDPNASEIACTAGVGAHLSLTMGFTLDKKWGKPLSCNIVVHTVHPTGKFTYSGGPFGGTQASMGPSAVVVVQGTHLHILLMSRATYDWADEQYRCVGLDPKAAKFIGVKNPMNFRIGYKQYTNVDTNAIVLDLPGPTSINLATLPYTRLRNPIWFPGRHGVDITIQRFSSRHGAEHAAEAAIPVVQLSHATARL